MTKELLRLHFKNLELSERSSFSDVKKSYRRLAMKYHPDRNQEKDVHYAESQFKIIKLSYEALELHFQSHSPFVFEDIKANKEDTTNTSATQNNNYYKKEPPEVKKKDVHKENNKNKERPTYKSSYFNHLLILNTDIFKISLKSNLLKEINQQTLNYPVESFSQKNRQYYLQFFNRYYSSLSQHKDNYHWLETFSLIQYLDDIISKISPDKFEPYHIQMKYIMSEAVNIVFSEYIQYHPLIKNYHTNGDIYIQDIEKKIQLETLHEFFLRPIKHEEISINIKSLIDKFGIQVYYLSGYTLKKIDYLKELTAYEKKQILESNLNLLFYKDKNICSQIIQEAENGMVSLSALTSLENMPLHYFINRFREILNNPENKNIHFEKLNLFIFKTNKLTLNLNNPIIKIPNALEKLLFSMGFKENTHLAYTPLENIHEEVVNSSSQNKKDKKKLFSYLSKIFK